MSVAVDDGEISEDDRVYFWCDNGYGEPTYEQYTNAISFEDAIKQFEDFCRQADSYLMEERFGKSTKKSQSIHSMIADIRNNNNSLKKSRIDISIGKNFYDNPYQDAEDDFQREMESLGRILSNSGIDYNLKDIEVSDGYGYEIVFHSFDDGKRVFDKVADWGDAHGFYTWLKDEGIITLTPN